MDAQALRAKSGGRFDRTELVAASTTRSSTWVCPAASCSRSPCPDVGAGPAGVRIIGWQAIADEIKADILANGVVDKRGVLRQHYDTDALDASTLLAAICGFLPPTTSGCAPACSPSPTS